jgi:hypothetical protein
VLVRPGKTVTVPIEATPVSKTWSIHRTLVWVPPAEPYQAKTWSVSHIPTGKALWTHIKYKSVARRFAELAAELAPWQNDEPSVSEALEGTDLRSLTQTLEQSRHMTAADMVKYIDKFAEKIRTPAHNPAHQWDTGYPVPSERRKGYVHLMRSKHDPEMKQQRGMEAGYDPVGWKKLSKVPVTEHEKKILKLLQDGEPRTFNRISVEIYDRTADIVFQKGVDDALWNLVERGQVEHDLTAPILFRATKPTRGRRKAPSKAILVEKEEAVARSKMSTRERERAAARKRKKKAKPKKKPKAKKPRLDPHGMPIAEPTGTPVKMPKEPPDLLELAKRARRGNPIWRVGAHTVETQYDYDMRGWAYQVDGTGEWHGPFDDEHAAMNAAISAVAELPAPLLGIGDVDPFQHDGGIIYRHDDRYFMRYFETYGDDRVSVFTFDIDEPWEDLTWVEWAKVADTHGRLLSELEKDAKSDDVLTRAEVYRDVAGHYGFSEFDSYPDHMSSEEAQKRYGADLKAVKEARHRELHSNPTAEIKARMLAW